VLALATAVYSLGEIGRAHAAFGYHALFHILLVGVNGAFLTGDLFNLYVWFEVLLIASFVLLVLGNRREQIHAAVPYVVISLVSSLCFLSAAGLLYGMTGTLNLAELSVLLAQTDSPGLVTTLAVLFLVSGVAYRPQGSFELERLAGLYRTSPWLAAMFLIPALSLAGLPPFSGFWGKLILIRAGFEVEQYLIAGVALGVGLLTLYSMTKIWLQAFWQPAPAAIAVGSGAMGGAGGIGLPTGGGAPGTRALLPLMAPVALLALLVLGIGLWAEPLVAVAARASEEMLNPTLYVNAVLGGAL
jgi:formate hydrogenlyase subunit 3/multisubunit Na+/H+ antiporter MnhD subunit